MKTLQYNTPNGWASKEVDTEKEGGMPQFAFKRGAEDIKHGFIIPYYLIEGEEIEKLYDEYEWDFYGFTLSPNDIVIGEINTKEDLIKWIKEGQA